MSTTQATAPPPEVVGGTAEEAATPDFLPALPVPAAAAPQTLFRTDDPAEVIVRATAVADVLKDVLKRQGLTTRIGKKDHVNVEGWQTVGAMIGVTPRKEWVRPIAWPADDQLTDPLRKARDRGLVFGYESSYFAQTLDGRVIGAAEATCKRTEAKWAASDDYAVESMAQTRATSKALGSVLRFIVTLAGYSGTPAEEVSNGSGQQRAEGQVQRPRRQARKTTAKAPEPTEKVASAKQRSMLHALAEAAGLSREDYVNVILEVVGSDAKSFDSDEDAGNYLHRVLDRLPAKHVTKIKKALEAAA